MHANRRRGVEAAALLALVALTGGSAAAQTSRACDRAAKYFEKAEKVRSLEGARRLRSLHAIDPGCVEAPEAAYHLLMKIWTQVLPKLGAKPDRASVEKEWGRFQQNAGFVQAIAAFRRSPTRPEATLALGQLYEAMSDYLDQVGVSSGQLVVIREVPEALYHTRAVDLGEYMKIRAENTYELVVVMLGEASRDHATLLAAREKLAAIHERHDARARERAALEERLREKEAKELEGGLELPIP